MCLRHQRTIYGVSAGEAAHISCRVDAHPPAEAFTWSFNTSNGGMDLPKEQYTNQGSASLLTYKPKDQMDYGTVLCLAENLVGRQVVPCVYHVIPAGKRWCYSSYCLYTTLKDIHIMSYKVVAWKCIADTKLFMYSSNQPNIC